MLSVTYRYRIPCLDERSTLIIRLIWFNINWLERVVDLFLMCGRVVGVTAAYHSKKLKDLDQKVSLMWYGMGYAVDRETDRVLVRELSVSRGTVLQSICSASAIQLEEIRDWN